MLDRTPDRTLPFGRPEIIAYSKELAESFSRVVHRDLFPGEDISALSPAALARKLYYAPFALVSHGTQDSPIFRYANAKALETFGYSWDEFTKLESKYSAEPVEQEERQRLLERAARDGYVDDYAGIRIAKNGKRFEIQDTILWNVVDEKGIKHGQAALIKKVAWL